MFQKFILPLIVPPIVRNKFIVPYIVPLRVYPEVKSVSELNIGIDLLKLQIQVKKEFGACALRPLAGLGEIGHTSE